ncbi:hypothetical protein PVAP13_6NG136503, partial [Panicum virgatum]
CHRQGPNLYQFAEPEGEVLHRAGGDIPHRPRTPSPPPTAAHPTDALDPTASRGPHGSRSRRSPRGVPAWAPPQAWRRAIGPPTAGSRSRPAIKHATPTELRLLVHPTPTASRRSPTAPSRCAREAAAP